MRNSSTDWGRIARSILVISISAFLGYIYGIDALTNPTILDLLINAVAILAGVLLVVISILGEPNFVAGGKWSVQLAWFKQSHRKVTRYNLVFTSYILTLLLIIASLLAGVEEGEKAGSILSQIAFSFFIASISWSIPLPWALASIQKERAEKLFNPKRNQDIDD